MLLNADEIQEIIPHRSPFLLVDAIESISEDGTSITGRKCVTADEPFFAGHFPRKKVMPGVLIAEALAQTGCVLLLQKEENRGKLAYFAGIQKMRFLQQVIPGDVLTLRARLNWQKAGVVSAEVLAEKDGKPVCKGEILCALA